MRDDVFATAEADLRGWVRGRADRFHGDLPIAVHHDPRYGVAFADWIRRQLAGFSRAAERAVAIDVGAHEGIFFQPLLDANLVSRVVLFDPHPLNAATLRERFAPPRAVVEEVAVRAFVGTAEFLFGDDTATGSVLTPTGPTPAATRSRIVPMTSLDDYAARHGLLERVNVLKIDTQGPISTCCGAPNGCFAKAVRSWSRNGSSPRCTSDRPIRPRSCRGWRNGATGSPELHAAATLRFNDDPAVHCHLGSSPDRLRAMADAHGRHPVMYWLDAHWCSADHAAGQESQCPLLEELAAIAPLHPESVVWIDDARYFMAPPTAPLETKGWPTFQQVLDHLRSLSPAHQLVVANDTLLFHPARASGMVSAHLHTHGADWLAITHAARSAEELRAECDRLRERLARHGNVARHGRDEPRTGLAVMIRRWLCGGGPAST